MSSNAWNMNGYQYDGSGYNYDAYEVTSFENEQAAFMGVCALANQSGDVVSGLGNVNVGSVQNVSLDGVNSHKACLSGMGSTLDSTMNRMGNALNARFKAEVEAGHLFGDKELPEDFDFAAYLKDMANEKTSEILSAFSNVEAGTSFGEDFDPKTMLSQNWESLKDSNPEAYKTQMDALYELAKGKDPSEWTMDELYASCSRLDDLQAKYDAAKARRNEAANWGGYDAEADAEMGRYKKEMKAIEADLKQIGVMEYSSWEKGWNDIKSATKALWNEGKDVVSALGQGDFKGAWQEAKEFGSQALATNAVVAESVVSGVSKINEWVQDGIVMLGATLATPTTYVTDALFGTDITGNLWDGTMDFVAEDRVGNAREWFYENTAVGQAINDASQLKWDSDGSTMIQNVSRKAGEITAAAAITIATGGTAAPLVAAGIGFLEGTGQEGERRFSMTDENGNYTNRSAIDLASAYLSGVGKGAEWYMYGDVAAGLAKGGAAAAAESLTGHSGKDALINMAKKADVYVDTAAAFAQGVSTRINTGEWNYAELGFDLAFSILGNYGGEYLSAVAGNRAAREAAQSAASHADDLIPGSATDKIDDLFRHTDDIDVPGTTVPGAGYIDNVTRQGDEIVEAAARQGDQVDNAFRAGTDATTPRVDVPGTNQLDEAAEAASKQSDEIVTAAAKEGDNVDNTFKAGSDVDTPKVDADSGRIKPAKAVDGNDAAKPFDEAAEATTKAGEAADESAVKLAESADSSDAAKAFDPKNDFNYDADNPNRVTSESLNDNNIKLKGNETLEIDPSTGKAYRVDSTGTRTEIDPDLLDPKNKARRAVLEEGKWKDQVTGIEGDLHPPKDRDTVEHILYGTGRDGITNSKQKGAGLHSIEHARELERNGKIRITNAVQNADGTYSIDWVQLKPNGRWSAAKHSTTYPSTMTDADILHCVDEFIADPNKVPYRFQAGGVNRSGVINQCGVVYRWDYTFNGQVYHMEGQVLDGRLVSLYPIDGSEVGLIKPNTIG